MNCVFCFHEITEARIHIRDECPFCGGDLHICLLCEFYDANAYRQCRESIREPVRDKDKANYCDFFQVSKRNAARSGNENEDLKKLNDLFK